MNTRYKNTWHRPFDNNYGPEFYETSVEPKEYCGFLIYERIEGKVFDIVENGVCIGQYAGPRGAREFCDKVILEGRVRQ